MSRGKMLVEKFFRTLSVEHVVMFSPDVEPARPILHHH